mmetsp:Transcript_14436/g.22549  ORF Transcript_14436/g.22549 Transcript_14436/m.22549 type:complete len:531 (+) Transcript_14436:132-1724(+)|eukprot:CAMPEP_0195281456 /NCGR_PEP_ID=MMETSP0707-20130614/757_1 /TAXON_ID=33640 /ORGANISM="Asterionellopsis glacialis, Strain CCMP134" /LENGTH=530 /DNA_ID=CAMNT_0040340339 /DNA_START=68 /DNA_END=1660 /DNA_ORIENTATION=-
MPHSSVSTSNSIATAPSSSSGRFFGRLSKFVKRRKRSSRTIRTVASSTSASQSLASYPCQKLTHSSLHDSSSSLRLNSLLVSSDNNQSSKEEAKKLVELGEQEIKEGRNDEALDCWLQALGLSHSAESREYHQRALWNLTILQLKLAVTSPEKSDDETQHRKNAQTYLFRLVGEDPIPDEWLEEIVEDKTTSRNVLDLLMELKQWSPALLLAEKLEQDTQQIRYEMATTTEHLEQCRSSEKEHGELDRQVLNSLAKAYLEQGELDIALERSSELVNVLSSGSLSDVTAGEISKAYAQHAQIFLSLGQTEVAWESLEDGVRLSSNLESGEDSSSSVKQNEEDIQTSVHQAKAELLLRNGRVTECLQVYNELLVHLRTTKGPVSPDVAKTLYGMGRICVKAHWYQEAVSYFAHELQVTKLLYGKHDNEVARILHELARIYDEELGEYERGLRFYKKALKIETVVLENCREEHVAIQASGGKLTAKHTKRLRECQNQIGETQKLIGRIHYKSGNFGMAMRTSFGEGCYGTLPR